MRDITQFLEQLDQWVNSQNEIWGTLLVGSYARGAATEESDVDLILICETPGRYLEDDAWIGHFGGAGKVVLEDWGQLQSVRVFYDSGLEVEFGITSPHWAAVDPLEAGTRDVVSHGAKILYDPKGLLAALISASGE